MDHSVSNTPTLYGVMAEFETPEQVVAASEKAYAAGYRKMDAYSPFPIHGLSEALGYKKCRLPYLVIACGLLGTTIGFAMQSYASIIAYPLNVGGRPLFSWPSFIPICFELTILFAAFSAGIGMLWANRLPEPYHPVFNVERFVKGASRNRFFLCIESGDSQFDLQKTRTFLSEQKPYGIYEVEP